MPVTRRVIRLPYGARIVLSMDAEAALYELDLKQRLLSNPRPLLQALAGVLREEARDRFEEGGRNPKWQRLAASTIAEKALAGLPGKSASGRVPRRLMQRGRFGPGNILIRTGALRDSWGVKGDPNHIETYDVKRGRVTIGSKLPYAAAHQQGTSAYDILAKAGKALAFTGAGGEMMFRCKVHHPGLPQRAVTISQSGIQKMREISKAYLDGELGLLDRK